MAHNIFSNLTTLCPSLQMTILTYPFLKLSKTAFIINTTLHSLLSDTSIGATQYHLKHN